mmetsp:Transcript_6346/g.18245  ORF Transcript_6346/g.18245 Transcript_6346/m.18245 type:complete len:432 (-) Transcript_6346:294-1589(-)
MRIAAAIALPLCLLGAYLLLNRHTSPGSLLRANVPDPAVPSLLRHVLVGISFHFSRKKLVFLKFTLSIVSTWRTKVDVCLITDGEEALQKVLNRWAFPGVRICPFTAPLPSEERSFIGGIERDVAKWALLWAHREVFETQLQTYDHTAFIYLEDDTEISWEALLSWGADAEALAPLGFQRGFFRTEVRHDGREVLLDVGETINMTDWKRTVEVDCRAAPCCQVEDPEVPYWQLREGPPLCQHRHYISMHQPFMGMWLCTRAQLAQFTASPLWHKEVALAANLTDEDNIVYTWNYPERSNAILQLANVPEGFYSASVVPYDPELRILLPIGRVEHERNGYNREIYPEDYLRYPVGMYNETRFLNAKKKRAAKEKQSKARRKRRVKTETVTDGGATTQTKGVDEGDSQGPDNNGDEQRKKTKRTDTDKARPHR